MGIGVIAAEQLRLTGMRLRRRDATPRTLRWDVLVDEWLALVSNAGGPNDASTHDAAIDLVETMVTRPAGTLAALGRFGRQLGSAGYTLDQVADWVQMLGAVLPHRLASQIGRFNAGMALSRGWAQGHLRGLQAAAVTDPATGLCTAPVMETRLQQVYASGRAIDIPAAWMYAMVIVSVDVPSSEALRREVTMAVLGDLVTRHWTSGETAAVLGERIAVLCANTSDLYERVDAFNRLTERMGLLRAAAVVAWVEPLPDDHTDVQRFLREVAS